MDNACPETLTTSRRALSQQHVDDYTADGYLRWGKILEDHEIGLLRDEYDREMERAREKGYAANLAARDGEEGTEDSREDAKEQELLQIYAASTRNIVFLQLAFADRILDIVEDLIGGNIRLLRVDLLYKPPYHGSVVYWHQDNLFNQCFPANMITGWLTLDDVDVDNGAMQMLPGSHLRPSWRDWGEHVEGLDTSNSRAVDLPAGGISFHHCQIIHNSTPNRSAHPRRAIVMRFFPVGTRSPRMHTKEWSFFMHPIVRMRV